MSEAARRKMTADEFYAWVRTQTEGRYELVDGEPVMMAGAINRHDRVMRNAMRHLGNHLDGHPCQPFSNEIYIVIPAGNRRQADGGVDCGTPDELSMDADRPTMVLQVLSPTTRQSTASRRSRSTRPSRHWNASCWSIQTARRCASSAACLTGAGQAPGSPAWMRSWSCRGSTSGCRCGRSTPGSASSPGQLWWSRPGHRGILSDAELTCAYGHVT